MNLLPKVENKTNDSTDDDKKVTNNVLNFDLNYLLEKPNKKESIVFKNEDHNGDDLLVDISEILEDNDAVTIAKSEKDENSKPEKLEIPPKNEIKLSDIFVTLESIKPSGVPPLTALEEKNGLSVILNFAKDKPKEDVHVIVATIISKNENPLKNILFQAVVPKVFDDKL